MTSAMTIIAFPTLVLLTTWLGVSLLFRSWRQRQGLWKKGMGWACLLFSVVAWCMWAGAEFGLVAGLCVPSLFALGEIFWHNRSAWFSGQSKGQNKRGDNGQNNRQSSRQVGSGDTGEQSRNRLMRWGGQLGRFLLVVPYAALAAFITTLGLTMLLPWNELSRVALLVIAAPAIWGLMAAWLSSADRLWQPVLTLMFLSLISLPLGLGVL